MKLTGLLLTITLIAACTSNPVPRVSQPPDDHLVRAFETAIADRIIASVVETLPTLKSTERSRFLRESLAQLQSSVDFEVVTQRVRREKQLLEYLASAEDTRVASASFLARTNSLSSVNWTAEDYRHLVDTEMQRIAAAVLEETAAEDLATFMEDLMSGAEYPEDSFEGRQIYLDSLADAMFDLQADWFDQLNFYETSSLGLFGEQGSSVMFRYNLHKTTGSELTVDLTDVENLPLFELKPLAAFYGFPGLEILKPGDENSLQRLVHLPGYRYGWGSFVVSNLGSGEADPVPFLVFELYLAALAQVDLELSTGEITRDGALRFLQQNTPYQLTRLEKLVKEIRMSPGKYLAALAGKQTFRNLYGEACESGARKCSAEFNQRVADLGVVPFEMLSDQ